eukprot:Hpha_TRINITY_DN10620_c0_g1::TRINITY_DN10620_c0_g1_i1::g.156804::m.156804
MAGEELGGEHGLDPVLVQAVTQCVEDVTSSGPPRAERGRTAGAEERLKGYLRDSGSCAVAYRACVDRMKGAADRGEEDVLLDTVLVVRQYLTPYPPGVPVLWELLSCVDAVMREPQVRSVLHRKAVSSLAEAVRLHGDSLQGEEAARWRQLLVRSKPSELIVPAPRSRTPTSQQTRAAPTERIGAPQRRSVQCCSVFGGRSVARPGDHHALILLPPWTPGRGMAPLSMQELVSREQPRQELRRPSAHRAARPKAARASYRDQPQLQLTRESLEELLETLADIPGGMGPSQARVDWAARTFVTMICESWASALATYAHDALRITTLIALHAVRDLLGSPYLCVRRLAFDIVFNLAVHVNLFEDADQTTLADTEVLYLTHEMLLQLVHRSEKDDLVWERAMTLWIAVAAEPATGLPSRAALEGVDLRALKRFLWLPSVVCDEETRAVLVAVVHDALFLPQGTGGSVGVPKINSQRLASAGGWEFIVDLYVSVSSWSTRLCCFTLLFEHIAEQLLALSELRPLLPDRGAGSKSERERQLLDLVRDELTLLDFHWYLPRLFKTYREHSTRAIGQWLEQTGPLRDGAARCVLEKVVTHLQGLSHEWNRIPPPVSRDIRHILSRDVDMKASIQQLAGLAEIEGDNADTCAEARAIAGRWLFALLRYCADNPNPGPRSNTAKLKQHVDKVLQGLAASKGAHARLVYVDAVEKHLLVVQEKDATEGDGSILADRLWEYSQRLLMQGESDPTVLLRLFHLVCEFLAFPRTDAPSPPLPTKPEAGTSGTLASMLLSGAMRFHPGPALRVVVRLFAHILLYLPRGGSDGSVSTETGAGTAYQGTVRHALLAVVSAAAAVDRGALDEIKGLSLWREYLVDPDPALRTCAATFVCDYLARNESGLWQQVASAAGVGASQVSPIALARQLLAARDEDQLRDE